jgi:hypothetical protein
MWSSEAKDPAENFLDMLDGSVTLLSSFSKEIHISGDPDIYPDAQHNKTLSVSELYPVCLLCGFRPLGGRGGGA